MYVHCNLHTLLLVTVETFITGLFIIEQATDNLFYAGYMKDS